jgi:hypothetical protein
MKLAYVLVCIALAGLLFVAGCTSYVAKPAVDTPATGIPDSKMASFAGPEPGGNDVHRNSASPYFPDHTMTTSPDNGKPEGDNVYTNRASPYYPDTTLAVR